MAVRQNTVPWVGMIKTKVIASRFAEKQICKLPKNLKEALSYWIEAVEFQGIQEVRKYKGYHDESLKGRIVGDFNNRGQQT